MRGVEVLSIANACDAINDLKITWHLKGTCCKSWKRKEEARKEEAICLMRRSKTHSTSNIIFDVA